MIVSLHTPAHFFFCFISFHSNNRIPPEGAIRLAMGLKVNKTIKSLNVSCWFSFKSSGGHQ